MIYLLKFRLEGAPNPTNPPLGLAEGARFELAVHGVDAGFQDRWFQPLTHPSENDFNYLRRATLFCLPICLPICEVPKALATSAAWKSTYRWSICTLLWPEAFIATSTGIPLASPRGQSCVSQVVKLELADISFFQRSFYLRMNVALGESCPIR